ncbi:MAG: hypothetical protein GWO24_14645 [Akkermansiaceae bacterium]|nr:hypothetical protein [Akkermansiaceae bacterium]
MVTEFVVPGSTRRSQEPMIPAGTGHGNPRIPRYLKTNLMYQSTNRGPQKTQIIAAAAR